LISHIQTIFLCFVIRGYTETKKDTNDRNPKKQMDQDDGDEVMSRFSDESTGRAFVARFFADIGRSQLPPEAPSFEESSSQAAARPRPPTPEEQKQQQQQQAEEPIQPGPGAQQQQPLAMDASDENGVREEEEEELREQLPLEAEATAMGDDDAGDIDDGVVVEEEEDQKERESKEMKAGDDDDGGGRHPASMDPVVESKRSSQQQEQGLGLGGLQIRRQVSSSRSSRNNRGSSDRKDDPHLVNMNAFMRNQQQQQHAQEPIPFASENKAAAGRGRGRGGGGDPPAGRGQSTLNERERSILEANDITRAWRSFVTLLASHFKAVEQQIIREDAKLEFKDEEEFNKVWHMRLATKYSGLCSQALEEVSRATGVSQKKNCSRLVLKCPEDFVGLALLIDTEINILSGAIWVKQTTRTDMAQTRIALLQNIAKSLGLRVRLREWC
jgi:hypothetical protein